MQPDAPLSPARAVVYGQDSHEERLVAGPAEFLSLVAPGRVVWLDLSLDADSGWLEAVAPGLSLHPLAVEDALSPIQRAKVEEFPGHLLVVLNNYESRSDGTIDPENLSLILGNGFVVTVQPTREDCWGRVRKHLAEPSSTARQRGADFLASMLVGSVVESLFPSIETVSEQVEALEDVVMESAAGLVARDISRVKLEIVGLRRSLWPTREAVRSLASESHTLIEERSRKYFRDAYDDMALAIDLAEMLRERVGNLTELYVSSVGLRQNEVLKVLTVVSSVFIPLTFVVGVYGMNFDTDVSWWNMPELRHPFGYVWVWASMLLIAGVQLWYVWRKGWLKPG